MNVNAIGSIYTAHMQRAWGKHKFKSQPFEQLKQSPLYLKYSCYFAHHIDMQCPLVISL